MLSQEELGRTFLSGDEETLKNMRSIRMERKKRNLSARQVAESLGIPLSSLYNYELGRNLPTLARYIAIAEFFGWNIQDNPNYIFYHEFLSTQNHYKLKKYKHSYDISTSELSKLTNYSEVPIGNIFRRCKGANPRIFARLLAVFEDEKRREDLRNELLRTKKKNNT